LNHSGEEIRLLKEHKTDLLGFIKTGNKNHLDSLYKNNMPLVIKTIKSGIQYFASIQLRSSQNCVIGIHNEILKIRLTAPSIQGEANRICIRILSNFLNMSPFRVSILSGLISRKKVIQIKKVNEDELTNNLQLDFGNSP
tara:strand:- start:2027 stop:2446 length:420 start_codon:yes stop_codon:yes gene_type:complete